MSKNSNVPVSSETKAKIKELQVILRRKAVIPITFTQSEVIDILVFEAHSKETKKR